MRLGRFRSKIGITVRLLLASFILLLVFVPLWLLHKEGQNSSRNRRKDEWAPHLIATNATKGAPCMPNISKPHSMVLIRSIGNSLPPRHSPNQTITNLEFTLQNEEKLPRLLRHWIINRIVDEHVLSRVTELLSEHGQSFSIIPFNLTEYDQIPYHFDRLENDQVGQDALTSRLDGSISHERILYTANVNGARNAMLSYGKSQTTAEYILPFDGNCFLTKKGWEAIQAGITENPRTRYFFVPMDRVQGNNRVVLDPSYIVQPNEEPQILFRRDAKATYNANLRYGNKNKVELMLRLKGRKMVDWKGWEEQAWLSDKPRTEDDASGGVETIGWIFRLFSGRAQSEESGASLRRHMNRERGMERLLRNLDQQAAASLRNLSINSILTFPEYNSMSSAGFGTADLIVSNGYASENTTESVVLLARAFRTKGTDRYAVKAAEGIHHLLKAAYGHRWSLKAALNIPQLLDAAKTVSKWMNESDYSSLHSLSNKLIKTAKREKSLSTKLSHEGMVFDVAYASAAVFADRLSLAVRVMHRAVNRVDRAITTQGELVFEKELGTCQPKALQVLRSIILVGKVARLVTGHGDKVMSKICLAIGRYTPTDRCEEPHHTMLPGSWELLRQEAGQHCPNLLHGTPQDVV